MKIIFQNRRLMENSFERRNLINNFEVDEIWEITLVF
jgi:hypothetical protein